MDGEWRFKCNSLIESDSLLDNTNEVKCEKRLSISSNWNIGTSYRLHCARKSSVKSVGEGPGSLTQKSTLVERYADRRAPKSQPEQPPYLITQWPFQRPFYNVTLLNLKD
nr:hypothetical protein 12ap_00130 [Serratia proteamaculans]ULG13976.1 hypothetical protein 12dp_00130 [Serratia proteamaculans]ULG14330.1 hypothetical protein 28Fp_00043 [Serratia proteamaculans]ULG14955.1 hypothetical protein 149p1_00106 [Serratia proteamaculans]ULG15398.1 hypothetical protein 336p_00129 [Serratia proteamaculans]